MGGKPEFGPHLGTLTRLRAEGIAIAVYGIIIGRCFWMPGRFLRATRISMLIPFQMTMEYLELCHRSGNVVLRQCPATAKPPSAPVNLDEFVAMFASKLNLDVLDSSSMVQTRRNISLTKPWFAATVTIASLPPHQTSLRSRSPSVTPVAPPLRVKLLRIPSFNVASTSMEYSGLCEHRTISNVHFFTISVAHSTADNSSNQILHPILLFLLSSLDPCFHFPFLYSFSLTMFQKCNVLY